MSFAIFVKNQECRISVIDQSMLIFNNRWVTKTNLYIFYYVYCINVDRDSKSMTKTTILHTIGFRYLIDLSILWWYVICVRHIFVQLSEVGVPGVMNSYEVCLYLMNWMYEHLEQKLIATCETITYIIVKQNYR